MRVSAQSEAGRLGHRGGAASPQLSLRARRVLSGPGAPLPGAVRASMEQRFEHDLSRIRVHDDVAARRAADEIGARAFAVGDHIVLGRGDRQNALDDAGLVAHEIAHSLQQRRPGPAAGAAALEADAEAAGATGSGAAAPGRLSAHPGAPQLSRVRVGKREFEVGDVVLNPRAQIDVRRFGVLLPGPDQAHIAVHGDRLGYEVSHTAPDDPFRWNALKEIVDTGHVEISAVDMTDSFPAREFTLRPPPRSAPVPSSPSSAVPTAPAPSTSASSSPAATPPAPTDRTVSINLVMFGASGITLPRLSVQQRIQPNLRSYVASTSSVRDQIYYESGAQGRGLIGGNSLAHELFGHLWLAMKGSSWTHHQQVTPGTVQDPFGQPFTGSVDTYIQSLAGASNRALQSPTQRVSLPFLNAALTWVQASGASHMVRGPNNSLATQKFLMTWEEIGQSYEILSALGSGSVTPVAGVPTPTSVVTAIVAWYRTLTPPQQQVFREILTASTALLVGRTRNTRLATDVQAAISQPPAPSPTPAPTSPSPTP